MEGEGLLMESSSEKLGSTSKTPKEQQVEFSLMLKGSLNLASLNDAFLEVMQTLRMFTIVTESTVL